MRTSVPKPQVAQAGPPAKSMIPAVETDVRAAQSDTSSTGPDGGLGHDFSQIAVDSPAAAPVQTQLMVNTPGDVYEQEADRLAQQVTSSPERHEDSPTQIQRFSGGGETAPATVGQAIASPGAPLESGIRETMEQRLGHDFGRVRVHSGGAAERSAQEMNAQAYTVGQDVAFGPGRFTPETPQGQQLLAHELTHVVQQSGMAGGPMAVQRQTPAAPAKEEEKPAAAGSGTPSPTGAAPLGEALPFTPGKLGQAAAWDSSAILTKGQIDPASAVGKAVAEGPQAVRALADSLREELSTEIGKERKFYAYFRALLEADGACSFLSIFVGLRGATYGMLRNFARLAAAFSVTGKQRRRALLTWAAVPTPETGLAGTAPPEPTGLRQNIVVQLDHWAGATEGEKAPEGEAKFQDFRTPAALEKARKDQAKADGRTYTTCVEFLGFALDRAAASSTTKPKVALNQLNTNLVKEENRKKLPPGAWHDARPKMAERPKAGDFYVMMFAEDVVEEKWDPVKKLRSTETTHRKDEFSHIGYVRSIAANPKVEGEDKSETWETVDGGAGTATKYKHESVPKADKPEEKEDKYTLLKQGAEKIELFERKYLPDTNIFPGGVANQSPGKRYLLGWIDVDYIV